MSKFHLNRDYLNNKTIFGGFLGITSAICYSIIPFLLFFIKKNSSISASELILVLIFSNYLNELISWICLSYICNFSNIRKKTLNISKTSFIIGLWFHWAFFSVFTGLSYTLKSILKKDILLMMVIGILSGPVAMILIMFSSSYLLPNSNTLPNVLLNISPLFAYIGTKVIFKDKISLVSKIGIFITIGSVFIMSITYIFLSNFILWKLILAIILSTFAGLTYGLTALINDYLLHKEKQTINSNDIILLKTGFSFIVGLVIFLPAASSVMGKNITYLWNGHYNFLIKNFGTYYYLLISGLVIVGARLFWFNCSQVLDSNLSAAVLLSSLLWTPLLQIILSKIFPSLNLGEVKWFYWIFAVMIMAGLTIQIFHKKITKFLKIYYLKSR
ncbi:hypothetical protein NPX79_02700 [Spiroplasma endosymbiont of Anurida maritima]|uniref:hypothetical protein n=1 Tax=Spiroplasma endosymbiont of Anurida maritima TaxID=2967972 RepID=UPI0036D40BDF